MKTHPEIQDFSLQISNLIYSNNYVELKMHLWLYIESYMEKYCKFFGIDNIKVSVMDVCVA